MSNTHHRRFSVRGRRARAVLSTVFLGGTLLSGTALATTRARPTGKLSGVVVRANGNPAARARVLLQDADGSHPRATQTDSAGRFRFSVLRQGNYDVRAQAQRQSSEWEHNVLVRSGQETEVTLRLLPKQLPAGPPKGSATKPAPKRPSS